MYCQINTTAKNTTTEVPNNRLYLWHTLNCDTIITTQLVDPVRYSIACS